MDIPETLYARTVVDVHIAYQVFGTGVLAHDLDRGRLLMADVGEPLRVPGNPPERWLEILTTCTKLQIEETGRADEHRGVT